MELETIKKQVLIVAKCNVNIPEMALLFFILIVLIVAKCNVNEVLPF